MKTNDKLSTYIKDNLYQYGERFYNHPRLTDTEKEDCLPEKPHKHSQYQEECEEEESSESEQSLTNSDDESKMSTYTDIHDNGSINRKHSIWLPRSVRAIIVGKSGFGKTTLLKSLLLEPDLMDYEKLMVCGKSLHQH